MIIAIPARMESSRLERKLTIKLGNKTVLQHTIFQCMQSVLASRIIVCTDSEVIRQHATKAGADVVMTGSHVTGTDRIAEMVRKLKLDFVVNVQGDEPFINPSNIDKFITQVQESGTKFDVFNGFSDDVTEWDYHSTSIPKCLMDRDGRLLAMSRASIPHQHKPSKLKVPARCSKQVCIYGYSSSALEQFSATKTKTELESIEDIEIIRFLELGVPVRMIKLACDSFAIDTPYDLDRAKARLGLERE